MMPLTREQRRALARIDRDETFDDEGRKLLPGIHFCPDWDYMPVFNDCPEKEGCTCDATS